MSDKRKSYMVTVRQSITRVGEIKIRAKNKKEAVDLIEELADGIVFDDRCEEVDWDIDDVKEIKRRKKNS